MRAALPLVLLLLSSTLLMAPVQAQTEAMLNIQGFSFRPARLEVDPGQAVRVTNLDSAPHSATGQGFDSGVLDNGASATVTAPTAPGEYPFVCKIHSSMRGTLVVRDAAATTTTPPATSTPASSTPASPTPTSPQATPTATSPAGTTPATATATTTTTATTTGQSPSPTPTPSPTHESPGPGLALLLGALAAVAVLLARRR